MSEKNQKEQKELKEQKEFKEAKEFKEQKELKEIKDRHHQLRKCCKNIFDDLKTLEEYEKQMKKEKAQKKKKEKKQEENKKEGEPAPLVEEIAEQKQQVEEEIPEKNQHLEIKDKALNQNIENKENEKPDIEHKGDEEEEEETPTVDCDLLFIMDCTGSMSSYINMCRTQLFLIVEQVKKQFQKSTLKIGFVGFRDFGDSNQFEIYQFTTEYDKLKSFINGISATGGNDTAEDVAGAFEKALEMNWTCDAKYAILITDAYPHGNKYCKSNSGDRYPSGDPNGRVPENQIVQMIKKGITFYGLDVSSTSNQMYSIFNQVVLRQTGKNMDRISMSNNNNANNNGAGLGELPAFAKAISTSVTATITQTITAKTLKSQSDVFNSKIMRIINNNRKFGTRFSKTNVSSKTEDDALEEYNNFRARYYDYDSSSNSDYSDSFYEDSSDEEESYYRMRGDFSFERVTTNSNRGNVNKINRDNNNYYKKYEQDQIIQMNARRNYTIERDEYEFSSNIDRLQQQKREDRIELMTNIIHEEAEEEIEEYDDEEYVKRRKNRVLARSNVSISTACSYSDQDLLENIENIDVMKPSVRAGIIYEDVIEEAEETVSAFKHKEEELDKNIQIPMKEKKRGVDEDTKERRVDPYIKKVREDEKVKVFQSICYSFQIDDSKEINWEEPQLVQNQIKTTLTVNKEKFSEGAMREAFKASDQDFDIELVAKLHKEIELNRKYNFLKNELTALILAQFFLTEFNQRILFTMDESELPPQILRFVDCYIYEVKEEGERNSYFYSVENFMKGDFQKYNNNAGYVIDGDMRKESQLSQAFSHFTWQYSQGNCMVVDLQGSEDGQLTDPQIHTLKKTKKFGQGDLGYEGILRFFRTHTCTAFCKSLQLVHPKNHRNIADDYKFEDFHALQQQQREKQKKLRQQFNFEDDSDNEEDEIEEEEEEEKREQVNDEVKYTTEKNEPLSKDPELEKIDDLTKSIPSAKATGIEVKDPIDISLMKPEVVKYIHFDEAEDGIFGIDEFFALKVDQKLIDSYVPPDPTKITFKVKGRSVPKAVKAVDPNGYDYSEVKRDCTKMICSLCKKVGEYNTKNLLQTKKKLNQLICSKCEELSAEAPKMTFDCQVCKDVFDISSYVLKMKRIDKAYRCEKCSLF
ncbi:hypothetical protein ABPG72_011219 [Tetrahymena utriculariae]